MSSHPDADAFIRAILADPADITTRLVFADWLEETETPANIAWAQYIRLMAKLAACPDDSYERPVLVRQRIVLAAKIRATLAISAAVFVARHALLRELLPSNHFKVRLAGFEIPRAVVELVPESVARENVVLPLNLQSNTLLVATDDPHNLDTIEKLAFILNKEIIAVSAEAEDIQNVINHHYGQTVTESVHSVFYIFPIEFDISPGAPAGYGDDDVPVVQLVNMILRDARSCGADRILISPIGGVRLRFRVGGEWSAREPFPAQFLGAVAGRVAGMVDDRYMFNQEGRTTGRFICRLGRDRFLIRSTIETMDEGPAIQIDLAADDTLEFT